MPRAPKQCGKFGCTETVAGRTYCPTHEAERQALMTAARGNFRQRGYDAQHDRDAKAAKADAIRRRLRCPRCGQPILAGQELDYGHSTPRSVVRGSRADRVEHAHCNRSAQARD